MIVCMFKQILENNNYIIADSQNNYEVMFEFYGVNKPQIGDKILIHKGLLDQESPNYTQPYAFKLIQEFDLNKIKQKNDAEYIVLQTNKNSFVLKRVYG